MNEKINLKLSVKTKNFRSSNEDVFDNYDYQEIRPFILERDNFTCQGCGFKTFPNKNAEKSSLEYSGYLEIHHLDDDHTNNKEENLVTVCPFCHQVFHFGFAGNRNGGKFIYLPDVEQSAINRLSIILGVSIFRKNELYLESVALYNMLKEYSDNFEEIFSEKSSSPDIFVLAMQNSNKRAYDKLDLLLKGARLLPNIEIKGTPFSKQIIYWGKNVFPKDEDWEEIYNQWGRDLGIFNDV